MFVSQCGTECFRAFLCVRVLARTCVYDWAYVRVDACMHLCMRSCVCARTCNKSGSPASRSTFEKILTEKCICYWIRPGPATVNPLEAWMGPMPNIKQLQLMKSTPTASIVRKGAGLPALPTELLEGLCNATKGGGNFPVPSFVRDADGIRQDICDVNVTYQFDDPTEKDVMYPCNLKWEPRAVEEAIARCVMADYLKKPKPTEDAYKDNSRMYTWNTTLEWWKEYTTIPPFDHVDFSRRKVNSYYTYEGCEACGMCSRLRLDSRNYENIEVPMLLLVLRLLAAYARPVLSHACVFYMVDCPRRLPVHRTPFD
jgi:hypothetical protein